MRLSTIYQQTPGETRPRAALLGLRIRDLRIRAGLTQAELGSPMTRSYVSAVERGRAIPSLPSLLLMASRLGVPVAELIGQLEWTWQDPYTADHAEDDPTPCDR